MPVLHAPGASAPVAGAGLAGASAPVAGAGTPPLAPPQLSDGLKVVAKEAAARAAEATEATAKAAMKEAVAKAQPSDGRASYSPPTLRHAATFTASGFGYVAL